MSVEAIMGRVDEIHQLIETLQRPAVSPAASSGDFAGALQTATVSSAPAALGAVAPTATPLVAPTATNLQTPYAAEIQAAASKHGVDPALLTALVKQESGFNPAARSPAGASGLTQLMPGTAASLGVTNANDPAQALDGGAKYLRQQLDAFGGDERLALAAYNAGPGAVRRFDGVPPYAETQRYVEKVLGYASEYRSATTAAAPMIVGSAAIPTLAPSTTGSLSYSTT